MASQTGFSLRFSPLSTSSKHSQVPLRGIISNYVNSAKPETIDKICRIVRKQLALPEDRSITGESRFAMLGSDSIDTIEIVMELEEEFGISVEEESVHSIASVQDAADLIEKLMEKKAN